MRSYCTGSFGTIEHFWFLSSFLMSLLKLCDGRKKVNRKNRKKVIKEHPRKAPRGSMKLFYSLDFSPMRIRVCLLDLDLVMVCLTEVFQIHFKPPPNVLQLTNNKPNNGIVHSPLSNS